MKKYILLFFSIIIIFQAHSQTDNFSSGARSKALADASVVLVDQWASFNNQAALAFLDKTSVGIYAENRFNIRELNSGAFTFALALKNSGTIALDLYTFNNSVIYSKQKFGLAYAKKLSKRFSAGIQLNFLRTHIQDYGFNNSVCGELGILYKVNSKSTIGVHVFNPTASKYSEYENERIPTVMKVGFGNKISDKTLIVLEVENSSENKFVFKGGFEYEIGEILAFQIGVKSYPFTNSFGFLLKTETFIFNLSLQYLQVLDATPGLSVGYYFN
ncbi:MAG: hypothetical protein U9R42_04025 [Bacteroidota bacterium]|nr:hypothetical protein [Bacteroidota bacterium]